MLSKLILNKNTKNSRPTIRNSDSIEGSAAAPDTA